MGDFKYFKIEDFNCQETGENGMDVEFIHKLDQLREACGFPFIITSGFGNQRYKIVEQAIQQGFTGVGIARGFIHVDSRVIGADKAPVMWCY